jgi:uncharacterized protein
VADIRWVWDPQKAATNQAKHGLSFEAARLVFDDPYHISVADPFESEARWRTIGLVMGVVLFVVHTEPEQSDSEEIIGRIISARKATSAERRGYHNG